MQVRKQEPQEDKERFKPFDIVISVESEEEAKALYAIFNHIDNAQLLPGSAADQIKGTLGSDYYVEDKESVIANGITYAEYYGSEKGAQ